MSKTSILSHRVATGVSSGRYFSIAAMTCIGLSVGFISRQNFYLVFTREIGCTPRDDKLRHLPENVGQCDSD